VALARLRTLFRQPGDQKVLTCAESTAQDLHQTRFGKIPLLFGRELPVVRHPQDGPTLRYANECLHRTHQPDSCPTALAQDNDLSTRRSGLAKAGVPAKAPGVEMATSVGAAATGFASPRSIILAVSWPSSFKLTMMLVGLMSRCTRLCSSIADNPAATWLAISSAIFGSSRLQRLMRLPSVFPFHILHRVEIAVTARPKMKHRGNIRVANAGCRAGETSGRKSTVCCINGVLSATADPLPINILDPSNAALAPRCFLSPAASALPSLPNDKYATAYFSVRKRT
jgi:hypothetical protein